MRVHITLPEDMVRELDRRVGARRRSRYIAQAIEQALDDDRRWELIESALGTIESTGHDWNADTAEWVRAQRRAHPRFG